MLPHGNSSQDGEKADFLSSPSRFTQWGRPDSWSDPLAYLQFAREAARALAWRSLDPSAEHSADVAAASPAEWEDFRRESSAVHVASLLSTDGDRLLVPASAAAGASAGAETSITAPATSQEPVASGDFDWLEVSCYVVWNRKAWRYLRDRLQWAKSERAEGRVGYLEHPESAKPIMVQPDGRMHGPRGAGVFCPWCVELWPGVSIHFADAPDHGENGGRPNAFVRITGIAFLCRGGFYWWHECKNLLLRLGARLDRTVVGRVDGCVDLVGVYVREFVDAFFAGKCVRRARKWQVNGNGTASRKTGLTVGTGSRIVVYDKLQECKNDPEKFQLMVERRWCCRDENGAFVAPVAATRVEFHLRNDELRENYGISSVEDLQEKAGRLFDHLVTGWFRLTEQVPDRRANHQSRAVTSQLWERVQQGFHTVFLFDGELLDRPVKVVPDSRRLRDQIAGCMSSALAATRRDTEELAGVVDSFEDFIAWAVDFLSPVYGIVRERAAEKLVEFRATRVSNAVGYFAFSPEESAEPDIPPL